MLQAVVTCVHGVFPVDFQLFHHVICLEFIGQSLRCFEPFLCYQFGCITFV
jgi:hypothetical protein